jgi:hypothetical protein
LEATAEGENAAIVLCDRGTVDGSAYWPGPDSLWPALGTTLEEQLRRYDTVIHLRTPLLQHGYNHLNPLRRESAAEAAAVDARLLDVWASHPHRFVVDASADFLVKAKRVLNIIRGELPDCCRHHAVPGVDSVGSAKEPHA